VYINESQSKFSNDHEAVVNPSNGFSNVVPSQGANQERERTSQNQSPTNTPQTNQELLLQLLTSQSGNAMNGQTANTNEQTNAFGQMNPASFVQANSQSLLLLQRIIQTTPEIQILHQQEQISLFQIQQNIKTALTQNLGQDVISQLVLEYQRTQEQHQLNIQAAIQRKLTLILCSNNTHYVANQLMSHNEYEERENTEIESGIFKYRRSSYHLGISYYIYSVKKKEYEMERQQNQMRQAQQVSQQASQQASQSSQMQNVSQNQSVTLNSDAQQNQANMYSQYMQLMGANPGLLSQNQIPALAQLQQLQQQQQQQ
jgi:hypothetical protein